MGGHPGGPQAHLEVRPVHAGERQGVADDCEAEVDGEDDVVDVVEARLGRERGEG